MFESCHPDQSRWRNDRVPRAARKQLLLTTA